MKMLVTGGAGFIGSNFIFYEREKHPEYQIVCLDNLTFAGNIATLEPVMHEGNFKFIKADIADREAVYEIFEIEHPDIVVNFAAEDYIERAAEDPGIFLTTNVLGTQVLLDACRKYGVLRYHQVSTNEVYADLPLERPGIFCTKDALYRPTPYSASKASADLLCKAYHRTYGLPITISRCPDNYGPYQYPNKTIPLLITNALSENPNLFCWAGFDAREWLYVEDHCKAIDLIIHSGEVGKIYNIGGHSEMSEIVNIQQIILHLLGKPEKPAGIASESKSHRAPCAIGLTNMDEEFNWIPETSFAQGLKKTVQWYVDNREWWENVIAIGMRMYGSE